MKIELENGFINYTIEENEIVLDLIQVYKKRLGTGVELLNKLKNIAKDLCLNIGLYSEPQDDSIEEEELVNFYLSNGFEFDECDCDGKLLIFKK